MTCAIIAGGGLKCWGYDGSHQLGDDYNSAVSKTQARDVMDYDQVGNLSNIAQVKGSIGISQYYGTAVVVITANGGALSWGYNQYGQYGNNSGSNSAGVPKAVFGRAP